MLSEQVRNTYRNAVRIYSYYEGRDGCDMSKDLMKSPEFLSLFANENSAMRHWKNFKEGKRVTARYLPIYEKILSICNEQ